MPHAILQTHSTFYPHRKKKKNTKKKKRAAKQANVMMAMKLKQTLKYALFRVRILVRWPVRDIVIFFFFLSYRAIK